jgi:ribosomal protein L19
VVLRNILSGIGVELYIAYFYNRLFFFKFSDFKRKKFIYKRAKLYYLRNKFNNASRIL